MNDRIERAVDRMIEDNKLKINKQTLRRQAVKLKLREEDRKRELEEARVQHELDIYRYAEFEYERDPITDVPDEVVLPMQYFDDTANKVEYNKVYAEHYMHRYEDTNLEKYKANSERIANCHKSWFGDRYNESKVFNAKRVYHCHNRWCWLCNHLKQAKRLYEYHVKFETLLEKYDLYHIVFTVKNVKGDVLKETLNRMQNAIKKIIRYFQGFGKIADIDFKEYGWVGAIRSFEIVINPTDYHPHIHCLFMLKKGLDFPRTEINKFSFDKVLLKRKYSKFEIMLQKMFYLLVNGRKVTVQSMNALPIGYSCTADCVEGDSWHEVFKYATKMSKEGASTCTYEQFVLLDDILHRMKMIQGYGIFYDEKDDLPESDPNAEIMFEKVLIMLNKREKPERDVSIELNDLVDDLHKKNLTVISKKMSYKYLKSIMDDFKREMNISDDDVWEPF